MLVRVLSVRTLRLFAAALVAGLALLTCHGASAQTGDPKASEKARQATEAAKDTQRKIDELADAAKDIAGPAGNPECVWLGRRVVNLLWRDDLDTAFRHLDLYDRFGCPGPHIQQTFRCVVRQGNIDPKTPESLSARVRACWINPAAPPAPAAAAEPANGSTGTSAQ